MISKIKLLLVSIVIISCSLGEMKRSNDFFLFRNYGSAEFFKRLFRTLLPPDLVAVASEEERIIET